ncbi:hypothetical protein Pla175_13780 [Pirellulimonas nuda]|uniref:Uncharacterized protein n=1 Tax=Pirellulimonas nuda TaxID=2528009 RepID=A0A518D952_9BACT|nr:hypothetical protein [Pirellulimonas nuda]QDU88009.1 hypothetical protein Pla175_13780 [Pirellulimonas nuda]
MADPQQTPNQTAPTSADPASTHPGSAGEKKRRFAIHRSWKFSLSAAVLMVLLSLLGIGLTTTEHAYALNYWISLVPLFGVLCIATAWSRARHEGGNTLIVKQVLHWLAIAVALGVDFYIHGAGVETGQAAGFNAALLLGLGCLLAGVHLEWLFALVGGLLLAALLGIVKADQYLWLIVLLSLLFMAAVIGAVWFLDHSNRRAKNRPPSEHA